MKSEPIPTPLERQKKVYIEGLAGRRPVLPPDVRSLEAVARRRMSPEAFAYVAGGAGTEETMGRNREGFRRWRIVPRMLRDVSQMDLQVELFGRTLPAPLLLSPIGVLNLARPDGDFLVARAAARLGLPFIFSNQASAPMEACAREMGQAPRWFQLYWSKSDELVASLVRRAEACGCEAIVVTLDTTYLGWRLRDLELGYLPFLLGEGIAQYTSDPVFQQLMQAPEDPNAPQLKPPLTLQTLGSILRLFLRYPGSLSQKLKSKAPLKAVKTFISIYSRPSLTWADLPFLRKHTRLPIVLKGILHPDDARKALDAGVDGIIVSNHGGRQVDGALSSIEALPGVVEAVGGKIPVLLDSGIRGGADIFKALALGARAVCVGRPYVYGLALGGEEGVREVLINLLTDFQLTMALSGCRSLEEIQRSCLTEG
ncbi:MAG: lactate 2-monooxygenase [Bacteroidetes bacterium]|nr:MAG: lactate 2-monooxygenase [Bacteroidota bacterium]